MGVILIKENGEEVSRKKFWKKKRGQNEET